jgi:succinyl-CoA synthetase beta subunit
VDIDRLVDVAARFGAQFVQGAGAMTEIEINPLLVRPGVAEIMALDALTRAR